MNKLTETQYEILSRMDADYCYPFRHFNDLNLTKKQLSKEFKILKKAGLVYFSNGLMTEEGQTAGSGYGKNDNKRDEMYDLLTDFEERNNND